jgi:hypothetical protein
VPPPPTGRPRGGSVTKNQRKPYCPAVPQRSFQAGIHHVYDNFPDSNVNRIIHVCLLNLPAVPRRGPEAGIHHACNNFPGSGVNWINSCLFHMEEHPGVYRIKIHRKTAPVSNSHVHRFHPGKFTVLQFPSLSHCPAGSTRQQSVHRWSSMPASLHSTGEFSRRIRAARQKG